MVRLTSGTNDRRKKIIYLFTVQIKILKWILEKEDVRVQTRLNWLRKSSV